MGDVLSDGTAIPGGTQVVVNVWAICRDTTIFPDADAFRPERWLGVGGEGVEVAEEEQRRLKTMRRAVDLVFGPPGGRFSCLGKQIAWMLMRKVVCEMVRRFDMQVPDAAKPLRLYNMHLMFVDDFFVSVMERERGGGM